MEKGRIVLLVLAGILIVSIFAGGIFLNKKYDLSKKFGMSGRVIDYGTYENEKEITDNFLKIYSDGLEKGEKTYLVLGNKKEVRVLSYDEINYGKVNLLSEAKSQNLDIEENKYSLTRIIPQNNEVEITINGKNYHFELKENENIYFIISEEAE